MRVAQKVKTKLKISTALLWIVAASFLAGLVYFVEEFSVKYTSEVVKQEAKKHE